MKCGCAQTNASRNGAAGCSVAGEWRTRRTMRRSTRLAQSGVPMPAPGGSANFATGRSRPRGRPSGSVRIFAGFERTIGGQPCELGISKQQSSNWQPCRQRPRLGVDIPCPPRTRPESDREGPPPPLRPFPQRLRQRCRDASWSRKRGGHPADADEPRSTRATLRPPESPPGARRRGPCRQVDPKRRGRQAACARRGSPRRPG